MKRKYWKWYVIGAAAVLVAVYFAVPTVRTYVDHAAAVLGSADVGRWWTSSAPTGPTLR